jgi:hypothetical protein
MLSVSGAGREGGNAGSDEEVWANPIIKLAVIAAPAYYVPTRTAVSNVFLYHTNDGEQSTGRRTSNTYTNLLPRPGEVKLCACSRRTDEVHSQYDVP